MFLEATYSDIVNYAKKAKSIVCFGVGKYLKTQEAFLKNKDLIHKIAYLVDNDVRKQNTSFVLGEKIIEIISFEKLQQNKLNNVMFLISVVHYQEIVEQILKNPSTNDIPCFILAECDNFEYEKTACQKYLPNNLKIKQEPFIPKVIHYCWFGKNEIPDQYKKWMESWNKFCPDYEIKEWNESNYDISKNKYMLQAYENKKWGFVPDYARLDIIYNNGGIYLDTDIEVIKNLDELLYQDAFAGFESYGDVNFGLGFGARKGLPIIRELMEYYDQESFVNQDGSLNLIASPIHQTKCLLKKGLKKNGNYQIVDNITIYPEKVLCGKSQYSRLVRPTKDTFSIHHFDASWMSADDRQQRKTIEGLRKFIYG